MKLREILMLITVLALPFGVAFYERFNFEKGVEPRDGENRNEFKNRQSHLIDSESEIFIDGKKYFKIQMNSEHGIFHFPSGPAQLIFDSSGDLVDWVSDVGESPRFVKRWSIE